ncbi:unnamed protein product [Soboliphyme baturini]|uniref:L-Fucosyltransferase n=1 Tax=Soboliphyme baturini TaxID=241478 RepID=A0A183IGH4_9BILA|nr:unnamed protein product [Soboliphyme baturini]
MLILVILCFTAFWLTSETTPPLPAGELLFEDRFALEAAKGESKDRPNCGILAVRCTGGLGNLMFEYASMLGLARMNNMTPSFICSSNILYDAFQISANRIEAEPHNAAKVSGEPCCIFKSELTRLQCGHNYVVSTYLQSWKYFLDNDAEIRREFTFSRVTSHECHRVTTDVLFGVHLRRGDLLSSDKQNFGHLPANEEFAAKVINASFIPRSANMRKVFIVVGDDYEWNKKQFKPSADTYVLKPVSAAVDMCVLSKCDRLILSTGTFGWWAAYLANVETWYSEDICKLNSTLCTFFKSAFGPYCYLSKFVQNLYPLPRLIFSQDWKIKASSFRLFSQFPSVIARARNR